MHWKVEQTETPMKAERNPEVYNVILSYTEIESMIAVPVAYETEQMVVKEISTLV